MFVVKQKPVYDKECDEVIKLLKNKLRVKLTKLNETKDFAAASCKLVSKKAAPATTAAAPGEGSGAALATSLEEAEPAPAGSAPAATSLQSMFANNQIVE